MKKSVRYLFGICLLALGVIMLGNAVNLFSVNIFFKGWWTLFIIIPSIYGLFNKDTSFTSFIFLCVGVLILLRKQEIILQSINIFAVIIAFIVIRIAFSVLFKGGNKPKVIYAKPSALTAIFSSKKESYGNSVSALPDCVAVFGSITLTLTNADFTNDLYLDAVAVFGGIEISVPENVNVVCKGTGIFGGAENKISFTENRKTLYVNYTAVFGGIEIK